MLDMICQTIMEIGYSGEAFDVHFRFLVILLIQCLFQFKFWTATLTIVMTYLSFAVIETNA